MIPTLIVSAFEQTAFTMEAGAFEDLKTRLWTFMKSDIYPNEELFRRQNHEMASHTEWIHSPILMELQQKAKSLKLWNMFLPVDSAIAAGEQGALGGGLTNRQYAEICEILGTSTPTEFASEVTNCTSPDTGNMEVLARYGTPAQRAQWLVPLLQGKIRSCYAMTEPQVASSDATNISINIARDEARQEYVINGRKWWITGAASLHCKIMILMGRTDSSSDGPIYQSQSQILVPMDTPGITLLRPMDTFGDDDSPKGHMEILFEDVRVSFANVLLGEGRGFEISQGRLGPGRIHVSLLLAFQSNLVSKYDDKHCMRAIGQAERALSLTCQRVQERKAFGKKFSQLDTVLQDISNCRVEIEMCRMLVHRAAVLMDERGNKDIETRQLLSLVKAHVPRTVQTIADRCIQIHGGMGVSQDTPLALIFLGARVLRIADGPDEVHMRTAAKLELQRQKSSPLRDIGYYKPDRTKIFRKSDEPVSPETQLKLDAFSKL